MTPLPDSTLLVFRAVDDHPLGLVPGDIVLGYHGVPWKELYPQLLEAELPLTGFWGSSETAFTHSMLSAAGGNWHLFDTIDVIKYNTGDTAHLSTEPLDSCVYGLWPNEQLEVPGVALPTGFEPVVSWGVLDSIPVGYIYSIAWMDDAGDEFYAAIDSFMNRPDLLGIILDFRMNAGGNMFLPYPGMELLFNTTVETVGFVRRCSPEDHYAMCPAVDPFFYQIVGDPDTFWDRPLAMLTGPNAVSAGDQVALAMTFHPNVRVFGKPTAGAFNGPASISLPQYFTGRYAEADAYLVTDPYHYLTRDDIEIDEPVWLTAEGVAQGRDDVVEAALEWVRQETGLYASASQLLGDAPLEVAFDAWAPLTDPSWVWDFGDGDSAIIQTPVHTYTSRGCYALTVTAEGDQDTLSRTYEAFIAVLADTLAADTVAGDLDSLIEISISAANTIPLNKLTIPVEFIGSVSVDLNNLTWTTEGCRTADMESQLTTTLDPLGQRMTIALTSLSDSTRLPPGEGPIVRMQFRFLSIDGENDEAIVELDGYGTRLPRFVGERADYAPIPISGLVQVQSCCRGMRGNVDGDPDDQIDIADPVYLIAYMFQQGPPPPCNPESDINGNGLLEISDLVYLVTYMFQGGPAPAPCP